MPQISRWSWLNVTLVITNISTGCRERESEVTEIDSVSGFVVPEHRPDSARAKLLVRVIAGITHEFDSVHLRLPRSFEELAHATPKYTGPDTTPPDPWGRSIEYVVSDDSFTVRSLGKDGISGTADDIVYRGIQGEGMAAMRKK